MIRSMKKKIRRKNTRTTESLEKAITIPYPHQPINSVIINRKVKFHINGIFEIGNLFPPMLTILPPSPMIGNQPTITYMY
jgi:hypothetical protein